MYVVCQKQGCRIELTAPRSLPGSECAPMTAATGYVRVGIVLSDRAEASLMDWILLDSRLCGVGALAVSQPS
ncbi:hypothetical protein T265_02647 [Opisthorchis viverrini]|uniref:Uncharacterized protein n=1 Tax=Opisthorchis viverrini TaxID=6198 RepID=A0A074ZVC6_OPIVI|nr:hypothetical protein T265_02647 [Opisthorchis viverrini]KER31086.1 hypothetical protein T265_02647 [Opisthorchis viverrini]